MRLLILLLYLAVSLYGLYALKAHPPGLGAGYLSGFFAYAAGFILWAVLLRFYPLSIAFPVAAGALILGTQGIGYWLLNEKVTTIKMFAVTLLLAGLALLIAGAVDE